jgi:hypothetical protein
MEVFMHPTREEVLAAQSNPALFNRLAITSPRGFLKAMFGLCTELYVEPRDRQQLCLDMLSVQENYYLQFAKLIDYCIYELNNKGKSKRARIKENPFPMIRDLIDDWPDGLGYGNVLFKRHKHPDFDIQPVNAILQWESIIYVKPKMRNELSYHHCYIQISDGKGGMYFDTLRECLLCWCKIIRPAHGSAGLCTVTPDMTGEPDAYRMLQQFPGLTMVQDLSFSGESKNVFNRIKTVNWLTVLGDVVLDELGGLKAAQDALEPDCTIYPYPGGIVIQAGPEPQWGDTLLGDVPELYRKVAKFTKPVRFENYRSCLFRANDLVKREPHLDSLEETYKWIRRFD